MYLCVSVICTSQDNEMSCICVLGVSVSSQDSEMSCICVLGVSRQDSDNVMYLCARGIKSGQ